MQSASVTRIYRYPVKGFSAEPLQSAAIEAGGAIPFDRAWAVENGPSGFRPEAPAHLPKTRFLMLMRDERLAAFSTRFDEGSGRFTIARGGVVEVADSLLTEAGRSRIEAWLARTFRAELHGPPRILAAPGHSFSDRKIKVLHLVNMASVRALADDIGRSVDPLRFRPNLVVDGLPPWSELGWQGADLHFPRMTFTVESRTGRCPATNVDPASGDRDMEIPRALQARFGHADFGVYVVASMAGAVAIGDRLERVAEAQQALPL